MCRKNQHKTTSSNQYGRNYNHYLYQQIRVNGGWNNWVMYPIEELNTTKIQALIREQYYIEQHKNCINYNRAYIPEEEKKKISIEEKKKIAEKIKEEKKKIEEKNKEESRQLYLRYKISCRNNI